MAKQHEKDIGGGNQSEWPVFEHPREVEEAKVSPLRCHEVNSLRNKGVGEEGREHAIPLHHRKKVTVALFGADFFLVFGGFVNVEIKLLRRIPGCPDLPASVVCILLVFVVDYQRPINQSPESRDAVFEIAPRLRPQYSHRSEQRRDEKKGSLRKKNKPGLGSGSATPSEHLKEGGASEGPKAAPPA